MPCFQVQEEARIELIELVGSCANKCRHVSNDFSYTFAANLERISSKKVLLMIFLPFVLMILFASKKPHIFSTCM